MKAYGINKVSAQASKLNIGYRITHFSRVRGRESGAQALRRAKYCERVKNAVDKKEKIEYNAE